MKRFAQLAWSVLGFNLLVILWGALVRASHSGEGCGDHWPLCNGTVIPHAAEIGTIIEFTHRATTGIAFFSVVAMCVWARRKWRGSSIATAATASLILIITEALLGAGLVLFRYSGTDASAGRAAYLSAHLLNTMLMLAAMTLTAWWASGHRSPSWQQLKATPARLTILTALFIGLTGAVTALADTLFPAASLSGGFASDFAASAPWLVRIRALHPLIAAGGGLYIVIVAAHYTSHRRLARWTIALVALQMAAGLLNLYLLTPVWSQLLHLLFADLLWITMILSGSELALEGHSNEDIRSRGHLRSGAPSGSVHTGSPAR